MGWVTNPIDDLKYHRLLKEEGFEVAVMPAFRTDKLINTQKDTFVPYMKDFSETVGCPIETCMDFDKAIYERLAYFKETGAKFADHGLDQILYVDTTEDEVNTIFQKALNNEVLSVKEIAQYQGYVQRASSRKCSEYGWVMQLHIVPLRNNNNRMFELVGGDAGFDLMQDKMEIFRILMATSSATLDIKLRIILENQKALFTNDLSDRELAKEFIKSDNEFHRTLFEHANKLGVWEYLQSIEHHYERLRVFLNVHDIEDLRSLYEDHIFFHQQILAKNWDEVEERYRKYLSRGIERGAELIISNAQYFEGL